MSTHARISGLLISATVLRLMVATVLRLLPYRSWRRLVMAAMREEQVARRCDPAAVERVVRAVSRTERFIPAGRCLERALTAWLLLHRSTGCVVRLGAGLDESGKPFAHAWLEVEGAVVLGRSVDKLSSLDMPGSKGVAPKRHGGAQ